MYLDEGDLRLISSLSSTGGGNRGRLEIFLRGEWGTVCDDSFRQTEANTACKQLGYDFASDFGTARALG